MGLTPAHSPMQKKQKGAVVTDIWTNDSPIAISRRQWVPPRPAVLNGEGCPREAGMACYGAQLVFRTLSRLNFCCRRSSSSLSLSCDGTAGVSCGADTTHKCMQSCTNNVKDLFDCICDHFPGLCVTGEFQVVADGVPKSPNGSGNTGDDKLRGAFPHLQGRFLRFVLFLRLLRVRCGGNICFGMILAVLPTGRIVGVRCQLVAQGRAVSIPQGYSAAGKGTQ